VATGGGSPSVLTATEATETPSRPNWSPKAIRATALSVAVGRRTILCMLTIEEAASRVGRSPETVRRWIRNGRLSTTTEGRRRVIDPADLDSVRDELYPMLPLPPEWQRLEDGTPAPNWVAAVALSRSGR